MRWRIGLAAALLVLAGCSGSASVADASKEIDHFHSLLDAQQLDQIWDGADPQFQAAAPYHKFIRLLKAVHSKLGNSGLSTQAGWRVNYTPGGTFTVVVRDTKFARGKAREEFVFKSAGGRPSLVGYNINSDEMLTN